MFYVFFMFLRAYNECRNFLIGERIETMEGVVRFKGASHAERKEPSCFQLLFFVHLSLVKRFSIVEKKKKHG